MCGGEGTARAHARPSQLAKWDHRVPFSGRALEILHDARKRSARGGRTEAPSSRAAAQDVVAHTWPEATADDTTTGSGLIAALDADSARVTVDDTIAFYDTAAARSATVVVPPNKTARVSRRRPRSSARDRTIKKMTQIGRCRWKQGLAQRKYSRTAHRPSKPLQNPREFRDESAHGPLRVERLGDPFAFLNLGVTGTRLY